MCVRQVTLDLTFRQAVSGCSRHVTVSVVGDCPNCDGEKVEPGTSKQRCYHCNGTGRVSSMTYCFYWLDNGTKHCIEVFLCRFVSRLFKFVETGTSQQPVCNFVSVTKVGLPKLTINLPINC